MNLRRLVYLRDWLASAQQEELWAQCLLVYDVHVVVNTHFEEC